MLLKQEVQRLPGPRGSPGVSQVCGVVQGAPRSRVSLVDVGCVLEQELTGDQRTLKQNDATLISTALGMMEVF